MAENLEMSQATSILPGVSTTASGDLLLELTEVKNAASRKRKASETASQKRHRKISKQQVVCPICEERLDGDVIFCSGVCKDLLHRRCAGLSKKAFQLVEEPFFCPHCRLHNQDRDLTILKSTVESIKEAR